MSLTLLGVNRGVIVPTSPALTNISGWWKADAITGVADGGNITSWPDSSGNGRHMPATATRPTLLVNGINGKPSVVTGDSRGFGNNGSGTPMTSEFTGSGNSFEISVVFLADSVATDNFTSAWNQVGLITEASGYFGLTLANASGQGKLSGYLYPGTYPVLDFTIGSPTRVTAWRTAADDKFYIQINDGTPVFQTLTNDTVPSSRVLFSRSYRQSVGPPSVWFNGKKSEIISYTQPLSESDRALTRNYLFGKYGV